jgi:hypothetical protein
MVGVSVYKKKTVVFVCAPPMGDSFVFVFFFVFFRICFFFFVAFRFVSICFVSLRYTHKTMQPSTQPSVWRAKWDAMFQGKCECTRTQQCDVCRRIESEYPAPPSLPLTSTTSTSDPQHTQLVSVSSHKHKLGVSESKKTCKSARVHHHETANVTVAPTVSNVFRGSVTVSLESVVEEQVVPIQVTTAIKHTQRVYVTIPQGIDDGETIVHRPTPQCGMELHVTVHVQNATPFQRSGLDLWLSCPISLQDALCGTSRIEYKTLDGQHHVVTHDAGLLISPGYKHVCRKHGIPRGKYVGNLILEYTVMFPSQLTTHQQELIQQALCM